MLVITSCVFRFVRLLGSGHQAIAVENLALRLQLAAFKRKRKRPVLTECDRLFWDISPDEKASGCTRWISQLLDPARSHPLPVVRQGPHLCTKRP